MKISNFSAIALSVALLADAGSASAAGCLKGAVVGGVAGHYAGHHAVVGAIGGCVVGHHLAKKHAQDQAAAAKAQTQTAANQWRECESGVTIRDWKGINSRNTGYSVEAEGQQKTRQMGGLVWAPIVRSDRDHFFFGGVGAAFLAWLRSEPATDRCAGVLFLFDSCLLANVASFFPVAMVTSEQ
jgi:hypothetical protein